MGVCFVYDPTGPRLYTLNTTAWLVLLLCDGADRDRIADAVHREVEPLMTRPQTGEQVDATLADLLAKGLIEASPALDRPILESVAGA